MSGLLEAAEDAAPQKLLEDVCSLPNGEGGAVNPLTCQNDSGDGSEGGRSGYIDDISSDATSQPIRSIHWCGQSQPALLQLQGRTLPVGAPPLALRDAVMAGEPIRDELGVAPGAEDQSKTQVTNKGRKQLPLRAGPRRWNLKAGPQPP